MVRQEQKSWNRGNFAFYPVCCQWDLGFGWLRFEQKTSGNGWYILAAGSLEACPLWWESSQSLWGRHKGPAFGEKERPAITGSIYRLSIHSPIYHLTGPSWLDRAFKQGLPNQFVNWQSWPDQKMFFRRENKQWKPDPGARQSRGTRWMLLWLFEQRTSTDVIKPHHVCTATTLD